MKESTFFVNSCTGVPLGRLEETGWDMLMTARGEVQFSKVQTGVGDAHIDIAGTIPIRTRIEQVAGVEKRHANRLVKEMKNAGFTKTLLGVPVSCVSSVDAWTEVHQTKARENRTANLPKL